MKVLMVCRGFGKSGGIPRVVAELTERLIKEHKVHLLTTWYRYRVSNLIVHKKPIIEKPFWLQIVSNAYYNTKYIKKLVRNHNIDIVHSHGSESLICDVLTMHSCHRAWVNQYRSWNLVKSLRGLVNPVNISVLAIEKRVIEKGSKKIIAISKVVKNEILENYDVPEEKVIVIPNGVDLEEFKPDREKREKVRKSLGIEENEIVLMFSGHEFERKGLRYIIEALPMLKDKNSIKLVVVGRDNPEPYKKLAQKLGVLDKVKFVGFVPNISEYYSASDVFVFPTLYEPFGLVILEAMASGLPVITSKLAGASEIIDETSRFLLLDDPTNSKEIAEKINILIEDDNLRKQMSGNARRTAENYSWDKIAKRYVEVYEEVSRK